MYTLCATQTGRRVGSNPEAQKTGTSMATPPTFKNRAFGPTAALLLSRLQESGGLEISIARWTGAPPPPRGLPQQLGGPQSPQAPTRGPGPLSRPVRGCKEIKKDIFTSLQMGCSFQNAKHSDSSTHDYLRIELLGRGRLGRGPWVPEGSGVAVALFLWGSGFVIRLYTFVES